MATPHQSPQGWHAQRQLIESALDEILAHPSFSRARVLRALLEFLVRRTLQGEDMSEVVIAAAVFDIPAETFHPYTHTNVRVQMHNLRRKLDQYYQEWEGPVEPAVRIRLPENCYQPAFDWPQQLLPAVQRRLNQARLLSESRFLQDLDLAARMIEAVLAEAPHCGLAWAIKSDIYWMRVINGGETESNLTVARHSADEAIRLAPHSWEANLAKGLALCTWDWDWRTAAPYFDTAVQAGGLRAEAHPWRQIYLLSLARFDEMANSLERLLATFEHPPHQAQTNYGICLHLARRHEDAERELAQAADLYPSDYSALSWMATVQWTRGRRIRALTSQLRAMMRARRSPPGRLIETSTAAMQEALEGSSSSNAGALEADVKGGNPEMGVALGSILLKRWDRAVDAFLRMADSRFPLLPFLIHMELVDPLWTDPRFSAMVKRLNLPASALSARARLAGKTGRS